MWWNLVKRNPLATLTATALAMMAFGLLCLMCGCATDAYWTERVDKGIVAEGGWRDTGIIIKLPASDPMTGSGKLIVGQTIGWGVLTAVPLDEDDSMYYRHTEDTGAGQDPLGAHAGSETLVRVEQQGYLSP